VKNFSDRSFCSGLFVWIEKHQLLLAGSRVLLAVSGGLDSMVMLDFFRRFGQKKYALDFGVAHIDHGLRTESAADALWLNDHCQALAIPFWQIRLAVADVHQTSAQSSLEAVARELRYAWLFSLAREEGFDALATAHTASDQAEGLLMRWVRGAVQGLGGMSPVQERQGLRLIRPLLDTPRAALEAYVEHYQLSWREDSSNAELDFFRNRIRAQVLPLLRAENPRLEQQWCEHALIWQEEQQFLEQLTESAALTVLSTEPEGLRVLLRSFEGLGPALQRRVLKRALTQVCGDWKIFTSRHLEALLQLARAETGKSLNLPRGILARKEKLSILICHLNSDT